MDDIQKFLADVEKIKKHERADNGGRYDGGRVCRKISELFISNNRSLGELGASFSDYWMQTYVSHSNDPANEPSAANLDKLAAFQSLLDGDADGTSCLTNADFKELCDLVNYEAEDLPLDTLNQLMTIFVDKRALK